MGSNNVMMMMMMMMMMKVVALVVVVAAVLVSVGEAQQATFTPLGEIKYKHASFVEVATVQGHDILLATSFQPFGSGKVAMLNLTTANWPSPTLKEFPCDFKWPNKVSYVPPGTIGRDDAILVPDGFLVPGKSTGSVSIIYNPFSGSPSCVKLTTDKNGYFYHMGIWRDMNHDGRLDLLTARVNKPIIGRSTGELLWLEQPPANPLSNVPWKEHVITQGPEVIFKLLSQADFTPQAPDASVLYVVAAQYFNPKVAMYQLNENGTFLQSFVVDGTCGSTEDVHVIDLDGDGRRELLVNTHLGGKGGSVFAYDLPSSPAGTYRRRTLATNFPVTEPGPNQASPGFLTPYLLSPAAPRPSILVAGDGSRAAYNLFPNGDAYNRTTIVDVNGVVGVVAAHTDKAGVLQTAFVPNYDGGSILVYTVK